MHQALAALHSLCTEGCARTARSTCVGVCYVIREFIWTAAILYSVLKFGQVFFTSTQRKKPKKSATLFLVLCTCTVHTYIHHIVRTYVHTRSTYMYVHVCTCRYVRTCSMHGHWSFSVHFSKMADQISSRTHSKKEDVHNIDSTVH